jgi:threonine dehydratase
VRRLTDEERARGVVGVSTGNHGRGLAYAAREAGVSCIICMSRLVPANKVDGIKAQGAEVRIVGESQDDAQVEVDRLVAEEILAQLPEAETLVVPVSGGGLIAGVARAAKALKPGIRIAGVSMERGAAMVESQRAGKPIPVAELATLADALGGGIGLDNRYTFAMVRELVDELHLVSEEQIADAVSHAYWQEQQIVEGSGAVGIAALKAGLIEDPGVCVVVLSGGNIDMALHNRLINGETVDLPG